MRELNEFKKAVDEKERLKTELNLRAKELGLPEDADLFDVAEGERKEIEEMDRVGDFAEGYVEDLKAHAIYLLEAMRDRIEARVYDSVLGDDSSGRIHALLISKTLAELYGERKDLKTVFVQGGALLKSSEQYYQKAREYLKRMQSELGKRVLIVTEEIMTSRSVDKLAGILKSLGIDVDIATFSAGAVEDKDIFNQNISERHAITRSGFDIFIGGQGNVYIPNEYSGLQSRGKSGFGHAIKLDPRKRNQNKINAMRDVIKKLAKELADDYRKKQ